MNNVTLIPNKTRTQQEAGLWLAKLDKGPLSNDDRQALREWVATSAYHEEYLHKLTTNWDRMDVLSELAEIFPLKPEEQPANSVVNWLKPVALAGMTALMALTAGLWFFQANEPQYHQQAPEIANSAITYQTAIGDFSSFQLEDGSTIKLNTNSLVEVVFDDQYRTVTLLRGEVNFKVAKNPDKPFVVLGGNGAVWAVGTQFNVRLMNSAVDVTVTEGKVKVVAGVDSPKAEVLISKVVQRDEHPVLIEAGQSVRYDQTVEQPEDHALQDIALKLAWQQGSLIFQGEHLEDAIAEISRYTSQQLVIVDPSINNIPIGGRFKTDDIDGLVAALSTNFDIRAEQVAPNQIHLSRE